MHHCQHTKNSTRAGFSSVLSIITIFIIVMGLVVVGTKRAMLGLDTKRDSLLRSDYAQKEEAFQQALLRILPERAMKGMDSGSKIGNEDDLVSWSRIFRDAIRDANAANDAGDLSDDILSKILEDGVISGNTGSTELTVANFNTASVKDLQGVSGRATSIPIAGHDFPPEWSVLASGQTLDSLGPVVSLNKTYTNGGSSGDAFGMVEYPNVRFGYAEAGSEIVARHNWWAISVDFSEGDRESTGIADGKKKYLLSLYEIPSQLPITADALMEFGNWDRQKVTIDGRVYASSATQVGNQMGTQDIAGIATRDGVDFSNMSVIEGIDDSMVSRDDFEAQHANLYEDEIFFPISQVGDGTKVAFLPINPGRDFYTDYYVDGAYDDLNSHSDSAWDQYARGSKKCQIRVVIVDTSPMTSEYPAQVNTIKVLARGADGSDVVRYYYRLEFPEVLDTSHPGAQHITWETSSQTFPFSVDEIENIDGNGGAQSSLNIDFAKLANYITNDLSLSLDDNHTLVVTHQAAARDGYYVNSERFSFPPDDDDIALVINGATDMTVWGNQGFSLVSNMRTYFDNDFNVVDRSSGAGRGSPPPVSIFTPEQRFSTLYIMDVDITGRIHVVHTETGESVDPLEIRGRDGTVNDSSTSSFNLGQIKRVEDLPPIFFMNWLVVVRELR